MMMETALLPAPAVGMLATVPIAALYRDPDLQVRHKIDRGTVAQYAQSYAQEVAMPPVNVATVQGIWVVTGGWHRLAALEKLGASYVEARVVAVDTTVEQARWLAASDNLTHGLRLKRSELREVFRAYVRAGRHRNGRGFRSYREMARDLGGTVNYTTVRNWMIHDFPRVARQIGGEDPRGQGGPRDVKPTEYFGESALAALEDARKAAQGITDPAVRGELLQQAEEFVRELQGQEVLSPDF